MFLIGVILASLLLAPPAFAQSVDPDPLPAHVITLDDAWWDVRSAIEPHDGRRTELEEWLGDYAAWQDWAGTWLNRRQWVMHPFPYPFWKDGAYLFSYLPPPRVEPAPPEWLPSACTQWASSSAENALLADGCRLLTIWKQHDPAFRAKTRIDTVYTLSSTNPRAHVDNVKKTTIIERIHFAGLWTDIQPQGSSAYGLAGVHATIDLRGRWQIYPFPGVMAVSVPNLQGKRIVTIGYDWGFAIRLFDLDLPYFDIPARAHLNLTEVWIPEVGQKVELIGLSFSLRKQR